MAEALLALGGNIGDAQLTIGRAIALLCAGSKLELRAMLRPRALDLSGNFGDIANRQLASRSPVRFKEAVHLIEEIVAASH